MEDRPRPGSAASLVVVPGVAAAVAMGGGALALFGWKLGVTELIRVQPGLTAMRPNAAAAFMLAGLALWLLRNPQENRLGRWIGLSCAAVVAALGGATLVQDLLGVDSPLDLLFYGDPSPETRMAELSASSFLLLGTALLLLAQPSQRAERIAASLTVLVGGVALLTLIGYGYGVQALYAVAWFRSEAVHSAVLFLALAIGVACARPDAGVVRLLRSATSGGDVARQILPAVVLLPVALGWGVIRGAQLRGYAFEFGIALYTLLIIAVLATLVWGSARALADVDSRRIEAEAALRRQEEQHRRDARFFHSVLDSLPDGVTATDLDGRMILWNAAADPVVRLAPAGSTARERLEAYGATHRDGSTPLDDADFPMTRALHGETVSGFEVVIRNANPPMWISSSASPLRDADGTPIGAVGVFRDISERRALEAQLYVADRLASVGMLAAGVAHEINNPLAVVSGNLQLLALDLASSQRAAGMVADATRATERIRQIVRDLKTLSRADSEKRVPVDVRAVLQAAVRVAWNDIRHRAVLVERYETVPLVEANEARLGQVFLNLVMNAAQAIAEGEEEGQEVRVATRTRADGCVVIEVADTGVGIAPELRDRLFTPFFTTKPVGEGSGLGLSICHRLVGELGGSIEVESEVGVGSTFRVVLPACARATGVVTPPAGGRRVLVVDDEPDIRELIRAALGGSHEVAACESGRDALLLLARDPAWDVVLCDLMMPGMSGRQLWERVQEDFPSLAPRMVFLTGGAFTADAQDFLVRGGQRWLEKPFDVATLRAVVAGRGPA
jgi:PAS domain S-box-containing protein